MIVGFGVGAFAKGWFGRTIGNEGFGLLGAALIWGSAGALILNYVVLRYLAR